MKIIYFTGILIAWIISPYIFIVLVPSFILMDFIIGDEDTHLSLIKSWKKWAFNQHGIDNEPTK